MRQMTLGGVILDETDDVGWSSLQYNVMYCDVPRSYIAGRGWARYVVIRCNHNCVVMQYIAAQYNVLRCPQVVYSWKGLGPTCTWPRKQSPLFPDISGFEFSCLFNTERYGQPFAFCSIAKTSTLTHTVMPAVSLFHCLPSAVCYIVLACYCLVLACYMVYVSLLHSVSFVCYILLVC